MSRVAEWSYRFYDSIRHEGSAAAGEGDATARGFGHLAGHQYCVVVTYKRSGEAVPTPVWFGVDGEGRLYFRSYAEAAKVRRIRNNPRVRVAPCTTRGKPLGPSAEGTAQTVDAAGEAHAEATIQSSYGLFRRAYERAGASTEATYVEVTPE